MVQGSNPRADSLSTVVIDAIANYRGVGPADLERPLYEFIDPDALDCLYQRWLETEMTRPASLTFQYRDLAVHVTSGGDVTVTEHGDAESDPVA